MDPGKYSRSPEYQRQGDLIRCPNCGSLIGHWKPTTYGYTLALCGVCGHEHTPELLIAYEEFIPYGDGKRWKVCFPGWGH